MDFFDFFAEANANFFGSPEPQKKEKASKKGADKKAAPAKKETAGKEKKSTGKGKGNFDTDVALPVKVQARGFATVVEGTGTMKLSQMAEKLLADGYTQFALGKMGLAYNEAVKTVFVVDDPILATDDETMVDFSDGRVITVADGQTKAEFSLEDFAGKEEDEVSLSMVAERFGKIHTMYAGCRLYYEEEAGVAYPVFTKCIGDTTDISDTYTVITGGERKELSEDEAGTASAILQKFAGEGISAYLYQGESAFFIGYGAGKAKCYAKNGGVAAKPAAKVETKYALPLELYIVTWNMRVPLTPEMFDGATKVTTEQIAKVMGKTQKMFLDKERKLDYFYNEELNMLSCMFISGKKGATAPVYADAHTGIWQMIRSQKEFAEAKAKETFLGVFHGKRSGKLVSLPHGNYIGYFGKELECCMVKSVAFERKLPLIPKSILDSVVKYFSSDLSVEMVVRILYNKVTGEFLTIRADGKKGKAFMEYDFYAHRELLMRSDMVVVMEIHSHNTMPANFSSTDDADETEPGVYGVIGNLDQKTPTMKFRCVLDGVFKEIAPNELFVQE